MRRSHASLYSANSLLFSVSQCLICLEDVATLITLHNSNNVPHQICQSCFDHMLFHQDICCPFCEHPLDLVRNSSIPVCLTCHLAPAVFHCFNPLCITGPISTPTCSPCWQTPYYLTHSICHSCASPRPNSYHK